MGFHKGDTAKSHLMFLTHLLLRGSSLKQAVRIRGHYIAKTFANRLENVLVFTARSQMVLSNIFLLVALKDVE